MASKIEKKLIFGTSVKLKKEVIESVLKKKLIVHTAKDYDSFKKLALIYKKKKFKNKLIVKIKSSSVENLKKEFKFYQQSFGNKKIFALQICGASLLSSNYRKILDHVTLFKQKGLIKKIYIENYWEYSTNNLKILEQFKIDGVITCYNILEREMDDKIFDLIKKKKIEIISLRLFSGFKISKKERTFINSLYIKYYFSKIFLNLILILNSSLNYKKLCLLFLKFNKHIHASIFLSSKLKNIDENIYFIKKSKLFIKHFYIINLFHKWMYKFNGNNSPSSVIKKFSLFHRIENFVFKKFLKI